MVKRKILSTILALALMLALLPTVTMTAAATDDVVEISDREGLEAIKKNLSGSYKLMNDIDLGGEDNPWTPIGNSSGSAFTGTFDGGGHKITGLCVNISNQYAGLFGYSTGTIQNLGVSGSVTSSNNCVGGVVGESRGTVKNCSYSGSVTGYMYVGGIAGISQYNNASVENCYNTATVISNKSSDGQIGGVVGLSAHSSTVKNCYNTGTVQGGDRVGGVVGQIADSGGQVENCYNVGYVGGTSLGGVIGQIYSGGPVTNCYFGGKCTLEKGISMGSGSAIRKDAITASDLGGSWVDSPVLGRPVLIANPESLYLDGGIYYIPDLESLEWFRDEVNKGQTSINGKLTADITMDSGTSWTPIGNSDGSPFKGTFDGDGHEIQNLYINSNANYQGLFSCVGDGGTVKNLRVSGSVTGEKYVGGIAGENHGTIENCGSAIVITNSGSCIGGITGQNYGMIAGCCNTGDISAVGRHIAGIAGQNGYGNSAGTIINCYNTGIIKGASPSDGEWDSAGGITGENWDTVQNCYNRGQVSHTGPSSYKGSIAGLNKKTIINCYYAQNTGSGLGWPGTVNDVTSKTEAAFSSGEVAWLLQNGQSAQVWGQRIGTDSDPVLLAFVENPDDYKVCEVTFKNGDEEVDTQYVNKSGKITAPAQPAAPEGQEDCIFGWYAEGSDTAWNFETDTISKDTALTAKWTDNTAATDPPATEPPSTEPPSTEPPSTEPPSTEPPSTEPPSIGGSVAVSNTDTANGTVKSNTATARKGDTVTISSKADSGYISAAPTVTDKNGNAVAVTQNADGTYSFTMPEGGVTVTGNYVTPGELYTDVNDNLWYQEPIAYVVENGLMSGVGNQQFNPGGTTTRGMVMTILARQSGINTAFSDGELWYQKGMEWAIQESVSDGTDPEGSISREQLAVMLWRYAGKPEAEGTLSGFADIDAVSAWAADAMAWAVSSGIIEGKDGDVLDPKGQATRVETAAMLMRFLKLDR